MKRFIAVILVLIFVLPTVAPWLPHDALDALHTQQEAHHKAPDSHSHGHHHVVDMGEETHSAHFDIISYFDNLHVDLKNPPLAKLIASPSPVQDMPFIPVTDLFAATLVSWTPKQSQGPPAPDTQVVSLSVPVYLATQRLRI